MTLKTPELDIINKSFVNKAEYLVWRAAWRTYYRQLSELIRQTKLERKGDHAALAQWRCHCLRQEAQALLVIRRNSKELAQRQYLAGQALPA